MSHFVAGSSTSAADPPRKKRQRACDLCRHKKIRCDGSQVLGRRCSPCKAQNNACTYTDDVKRLWPDNQSVVELQQKLERMESLLAQLSPGSVDQQELEQDTEHDQQMSTAKSFPTSAFSTPPENTEFSDDDEDPDGITIGGLAGSLPMLNGPRFYGKSSGVMSVHRVFNSRNDCTKSSPGPITVGDPFHIRLNFKRSKFWDPNPWDITHTVAYECKYIFPEHDLLFSLVDLYFEHINVFTPLLHRPTFDKDVREGLHLRDKHFGAMVLLVCAVASRFSPDPRVIYKDTNTRYSAGYRWFQQVEIVDENSLSAVLTLHEMQMYCLAVFFSHWTANPLPCWTIVGIAIRRAQDVGVHRRKLHRGRANTVEIELWKRGFWILVVMDRYMSSALGRPCAIQDDEFDLEYPAECDDEYWEQSDPAQCFKQPPGKLSTITSFVLYIKLQQIMALALRTVYSINVQVKALHRLIGPDWQEKVVAEMDSALNEWTDLIPAQLRWDPIRQNDIFFNQSAMLYAAYYHAQILIHRPFISPAKRNSPLAFPSLVICTNAARSGSQVVGIHRQRSSALLPYIHMPTFTNGIVLLLHIWASKRFGFPVGDMSRDWAAVHLCMDALRAEEGRWQVAGRLWDILHELTRVIEQPLPSGQSHSSDTAVAQAQNSISSFPAPSSASNPAFITGPGKATVGQEQQEQRTAQEQRRSLLQEFQQAHPVGELSTMPGPFAQPIYGGDEASGSVFPNQINHNFASGIADMDLTGDERFFNHVAGTGAQPYAPPAQGNEQNLPLPLDINWSAMQGVEDMDTAFTDDTFAMWGNAPSSFEYSDWETYLSNGMVCSEHTPPAPSL